MPYWNSEIVVVTGERAFEIPTSSNQLSLLAGTGVAILGALCASLRGKRD
jgi:hypothetical protein